MKKNKKNFIILFVVAIIIGIIVFLLLRNKNLNTILNVDSQKPVTQTETKQIETSQQDNEQKLDNGTTSQENGQYQERSESGAKVNTSEKLKEEKKYGTLKFTNINLTGGTEESNLTADVKNESESELNDFTTVDINFYDEKGNVINTIVGLVKPLKPEEITQLDASVSMDLTNAYDIEIVKHDE